MMINLLDNTILKQDLEGLFDDILKQSSNILTVDKKWFSLLSRYIIENKKEFIGQIMQETGYILRDCEDLVNGSIELISFFDKHIKEVSDLSSSEIVNSFFDHPIPCKISLRSKPFGVVAAMTPQNAPLILELTVILNALAAGNSIILRPSGQCLGTATLLVNALSKTLPHDVLKKIRIISASATDFLEVSYHKANLIHYIGSSKYGSKILIDAISNNVPVLVDGDGSSMVIIDKSVDIGKAVKACFEGIIRCNGELCSSVRTILVEGSKYKDFCKMLCKELEKAKVGPLFNEAQVERIREVGKQYQVLYGHKDIIPALFKLKITDLDFLKAGIFGPVAGVVSYEGEEWKDWVKGNQYPLNDVVFSTQKKFIEEVKIVSRAPRIVINHDPSVESVFEPWGAFLPSGLNSVSFWVDKYRKIIQLDTN